MTSCVLLSVESVTIPADVAAELTPCTHGTYPRVYIPSASPEAETDSNNLHIEYIRPRALIHEVTIHVA